MSHAHSMPHVKSVHHEAAVGGAAGSTIAWGMHQAVKIGVLALLTSAVLATPVTATIVANTALTKVVGSMINDTLGIGIDKGHSSKHESLVGGAMNYVPRRVGDTAVSMIAPYLLHLALDFTPLGVAISLPGFAAVALMGDVITKDIFGMHKGKGK